MGAQYIIDTQMSRGYFIFFAGGGGALRLAAQIGFAWRMTGKEIGVTFGTGPKLANTGGWLRVWR